MDIMRQWMRLVEAFAVKAYHGTGANIDRFRAKNLSGRGSHFLDIGIHFSENPALASEYASFTGFDARFIKGLSSGLAPGGNPVVYPVMLDPGRVLDLTAIYAPDHDAPDDLQAALVAAYQHIASAKTVKTYQRMLNYDPVLALTHYQLKAGRRALRNLIVSLGYDSIRYELFGSASNYVVFDPRRIRMMSDPADQTVTGSSQITQSSFR